MGEDISESEICFKDVERVTVNPEVSDGFLPPDAVLNTSGHRPRE